jgi:hypothetical protein
VPAAQVRATPGGGRGGGGGGGGAGWVTDRQTDRAAAAAAAGMLRPGSSHFVMVMLFLLCNIAAVVEGCVWLLLLPAVQLAGYSSCWLH